MVKGHDPNCDQPIKQGHCMAFFPSYGYDTNKQKCVYFVYGGCAGNHNRFDTIQECQQHCQN